MALETFTLGQLRSVLQSATNPTGTRDISIGGSSGRYLTLLSPFIPAGTVIIEGGITSGARTQVLPGVSIPTKATTTLTLRLHDAALVNDNLSILAENTPPLYWAWSDEPYSITQNNPLYGSEQNIGGSLGIPVPHHYTIDVQSLANVPAGESAIFFHPIVKAGRIRITCGNPALAITTSHMAVFNVLQSTVTQGNIFLTSGEFTTALWVGKFQDQANRDFRYWTVSDYANVKPMMGTNIIYEGHQTLTRVYFRVE